MKALLKLIVVCIWSLTFMEGSAQKPAQTIPEFTFYKLDKTPFTNKNVVTGKESLFIFFDVTCDHCQHTIKTLSARTKECRDISIYLISLEDKTAINTFFNQYGKNLPAEKNVTILQDSKNQFITQFGPRKYPSVFLYSAQKKLLLYDDEDQYLEKFFKIINSQKKS
jgi:peroxiredoxin